MPQPAGVEKEGALRAAGFNDGEIDQWRSSTASDLMSAGFSTSEVDEYFGGKNPDMKPLKAVFDKNLQENALNSETGQPKKAETFHDAIEAGWQMSVTGLIKRGQKPDVVLPEDAPMYYRIASQVSGLAGDLPAMWGGAAAGGAAAAPVAGAVALTPAAPAAPVIEAVGSGYGAFALPAAIRTVLMQHYEKGDVKDFDDFWGRAAATFIEANKQGMVGAATAGVGATVGKVAAGVGAKAVVKTTAQLSSEVATMVTVGKAMEGEVPQPQDFIDAAILVGGMHGVMKAGPKLREAYSKGNVKPSEIAQQAINDPLVKQDLLAEGPKGVVPEAIAKANGINPNPELTSVGAEVGAAKDGAPTSPKVPERTEAQQKIAEQIGEKEEPKKDGLSFRGFYKDVVDKLDPINEALKATTEDVKTLSPDQNGYILSRMANDYKAKTKYSIEKGTLDFKTLAKNGEGLSDIIEPFKKDPQQFDLYLAAKRAIEVEGQGKTSGFDIEAAKQVVKEGKATFEDAAKRFYDFKNRNLEYLRDSGVLSKDEYKNFTEVNKDHVTFSRILEDEKGGGGTGPRRMGSLKEFKGSNAKIESPLLVTLRNTETMFKIAEKNRARRALVDQVLSDPEQNLLEKTDGTGKLKDDEFELWRDGKREVYSTTKDAPVGLAEAIKSLDGDMTAQNIVMKIARGFTTVKKFAITIMPDFILKNIFRDQLTAGTLTTGKLRPFVDILPAMKDLISKNDNYYDWLKSGGAQGTFLDVSRDYLEKDIYALDKKTDLMSASWNVLKKPVDFIQAAGMLAEHATRLAEFKRVTKGETSGPKIFAGGFSSREVSVDFSRVGAKISALNAITAFMNMNIQGVDRAVRAMKDNPAGTTMKAATWITLPSVLLWYANHNDERYKQLPRWQKDLFWIIPTDHWVKAEGDQADGIPEYLTRKNSKGEIEINDGPIFRIPKPQELGLIFGTVPERAMEKFFTDNPKALDDFESTVGQLATPSMVPDAVAPIREQWANKSLFTGNKIVSGPIEKVLPAYQYNEYTTETAKALGKMIRILPAAVTGKSPDLVDLPSSSPVVIENYVRGWSGNLGMYALQVADKALEKAHVTPDAIKPSDTLADIPFIKSFVVRYPSSGAQPIQDFYNEYSKHAKVADTITHLAKTGDFESLGKELQDPQVQDMIVKLKGINDALHTQAQFARRVYKNPEFSSSDQRQMLDGIYYGMIETAKMGNTLMLTIEKAQKAEGN